MKRFNLKAFDAHNEWLDRYNAARSARPVLTAGELMAAREGGMDPAEAARANDALAAEYDAIEE